MLCNSDAKKDLIKRDAHSLVFVVALIRLTLGSSTCQQSDRYPGVSQVDSFAACKASWMIFFDVGPWPGLLLLFVGGMMKRSSGWGNCESSLLRVVCLFRCFWVTN